MIQEREQPSIEEILPDPAYNLALSVEEAIRILIADGEAPRQAQKIVMYARGLWTQRHTFTRVIDGQALEFIVD